MEIGTHVQIMRVNQNILKIIKDHGGLGREVKSDTFIKSGGVNCEGLLSHICCSIK